MIGFTNSVLILSALVAAIAAAPEGILLQTAQEFASGVRSWKGGYDIDLYVKRPPIGTKYAILNGTSIELIPLANPDGKVTSGKLQFLPEDQDPSWRAIVDLGNKAYVFPVLDGSAQATLYNMTLAGFCFYPFEMVPGVMITQSMSSIFFSLAPYSPETLVGRRFNHVNAHIYSTPGEVAMTQYHLLLMEDGVMSIPQISPYSQIWLDRFLIINPLAEVHDVTPWSIRYTAMYPSVSARNFTLAAFSNPSGPFATGEVPMPLARYCLDQAGTGPLLPQSESPTNTSVSPIWYATNTNELHVALDHASAYLGTSPALPVAWPAAVLLLGDTSLAGSGADITQGSSTALHSLPGLTILNGPFVRVRSSTQLSLGGATTPLLNMTAPNGTTHLLVIRQLVLTGLGAAPLAPLMAGQPSVSAGSYKSALPLWALAGSIRNSTVLWLDKVTLVVPQADFAALLSAALRGAAWETGASTTAPLFAGITVFEVARREITGPVTTASHTLALDVLNGWGIHALSLIVMPEVPLPPGYSLPDYVAPNPPIDVESGTSRSSLRIGLGVGLGVGGGLLVLVLVGITVHTWLAHNHRSPAPAVSSKAGSQDHETGGTGGADGTSGTSSTPGQVSIDIATTRSAGSRLNGMNETKGMNGVNARPHGPMSSFQHAIKLLSTDRGIDRRVLKVGTRGSGENASQGSPMADSLSGRQGSSVMDLVEAAANVLNKGQAEKLVLTGIIGKGSYGTVYDGQWRGMRVAVKTLLFASGPTNAGERERGVQAEGAGNTAPQSTYERAVNEAAVAISVIHPNVVATYRYDFKVMRDRQEEGQFLEVDVGQVPAEQVTDFKLYLIQEKCDTSLADALDHLVMQSVPSDTKEIIVSSLLTGIATGVSYLHDRNIIHGDLKPDNVLLKLDSNSPCGVTAKVTDFGLAIVMDPTATHVSNCRVGTMFYMAPEVATDARLTRAADMYSFGVIMWTLLAGENPYLVHDDGSFSPHPSFPLLPAHVDLSSPSWAQMHQLMRRCLSGLPHERPSAAAVLSTLQEVMVEASNVVSTTTCGSPT